VKTTDVMPLPWACNTHEAAVWRREVLTHSLLALTHAAASSGAASSGTTGNSIEEASRQLHPRSRRVQPAALSLRCHRVSAALNTQGRLLPPSAPSSAVRFASLLSPPGHQSASRFGHQLYTATNSCLFVSFSIQTPSFRCEPSILPSLSFTHNTAACFPASSPMLCVFSR
jgi:hypothetical protein